LSDLVGIAESDASVGLVSPLIASDEGDHEITYAGAYIDFHALVHDTTGDVEEGQRWMRERPQQFVVYATALLVRIEMATKIGGFDDKFFMYWDDYDLSVRCTAAGYTNVVSVKSVIQHEDKNFHALLDRIKPHYFYYYYRGYLLLWRKHWGVRRSLRVFWRTTRAAMRVRRAVGDNSVCGEAIVAGLWHGYTRRYGEYRPPIRVPGVFRYVLNVFARRVN
jgi:GT2 family glycosyltransferase